MSPRLKSDLDTELESIDADLALLQGNRLRTQKVAWQGLPTHVATTPADGVAISPDGKVRRSKDNENKFNADWNTFGVTLPTTMIASVRVDTYTTPEGEQGWVVVGQVVVGEDLYERRINHGVQTERSHDWEIRPSLVDELVERTQIDRVDAL